MSVFRIVGNYYEDILDYYTREYKKIDPTFDPIALQEEYIKFQADTTRSPKLVAFKTNFEAMFTLRAEQTAKKTEIMQNLASAFARVHRLNQSTWSYWNARQKVFRTMIIVMSIMIIITFIILLYMIRIRMRYSKDGDVFSADNIQSILLYIIVYTIFFTIMLMLLLLMIEGVRMSSTRKKDNNVRFTNFNVMLIPNIHMLLFLQAIGYYMQNNTSEYTRVFNQLKSSIRRTGEGGTDKCAPGTTAKIVDVMISKNPCKKQANLSDLYDALQVDIKDFVFQFYSYGYGYIALKKTVIKSSNAYILKEVRKIFSFYYYLFNKRGEYDVERSLLESNQKILDNIVVTKFRDLGISYFIASEGSNDDVVMQAMNEDSSKNPKFNTQATLFENAIKHLLIYAYPLYFAVLPASADFNTRAPLVSSALPTRLTPRNDFEIKTKAFFEMFPYETYTDFVNRMKIASPQEKQILFNLFLQKSDVYIEGAMVNLLLAVEGASTFPLNQDYIKQRIANVMKDRVVEQTKSSYRGMFETAFVEHLVPVIRKNILSTIDTVDVSKGINSVINYKIHILSNQLANDLAEYNINVMENFDYVMNQLEKENDDTRLLNIYTKVLYGLDGLVETKRKMRRSSQAATQGRFLSTPEFITRLNTITYDDFYRGLDTKYAYDILNDFYMEVSHASGTSGMNRTEQNIFYQQMKNFRMSKTFIIMVTIVISMGYIYYAIPQIKIWNKISNSPEPESATGQVIRSINHVNIAAKTLIPLVATVFIIVLLFSYHAKSVHKFEFNKETIETNTSYLLSALSKLDSIMGGINSDPQVDSKRYAAIGDIQEIKEEAKTDMYKYMMDVIMQYEKCNYIINVSRNKLPFPYTELTVDIFMLGVTLMTMVYLTMTIGPIARLQKIKELNKKREDAIIMTVSSLKEVADKEKQCNTEDVEAIVFTIKVIIFTAIFLFLIFYTVTILESTTEFKMGLYNSVYFEESRCYTGHD